MNLFNVINHSLNIRKCTFGKHFSRNIYFIFAYKRPSSLYIVDIQTNNLVYSSVFLRKPLKYSFRVENIRRKKTVSIVKAINWKTRKWSLSNVCELKMRIMLLCDSYYYTRQPNYNTRNNNNRNLDMETSSFRNISATHFANSSSRKLTANITVVNSTL